jgi:hypothetical protein
MFVGNNKMNAKIIISFPAAFPQGLLFFNLSDNLQLHKIIFKCYYAVIEWKNAVYGGSRD